MTIDPPRLLEDLSANAALRGDLTEASLATVEGLDLTAGLASLTAATATMTSSTAAVSGTPLLAKIGIGAVLTAGAIGAWVGLSGPSEPETPAAAALVTQGPAPVAASPKRASKSNPSVLIDGVEIPPAEVTKPAPSAAPEEPVETPAHEVSETPVDATPEAHKAPRRSHRSHKSANAGAPPVDDAVLREAKTIAAARASLAGNPGKSLRLVKDADREFPNGQLIEERRAIEIQALVKLGRRDQAQQRADAFLTKYGRGAHAAAVRRALAAD